MTARGTLVGSGITRRSLSLGQSWWTPWSRKWMRLPQGVSLVQWNTHRWSTYSESVQLSAPHAKSAATVISVRSCRSTLRPRKNAPTGTQTTKTVAGWMRENFSRKSLSNIRHVSSGRTRDLRRTVGLEGWATLAMSVGWLGGRGAGGCDRAHRRALATPRQALDPLRIVRGETRYAPGASMRTAPSLDAGTDLGDSCHPRDARRQDLSRAAGAG